jgi:hypothetical protein
VHAPKQQRMVGDKQVRLPRRRFLDDRHHRVDGEQHPAYRVIGVPDDEADRVPLLGPARIVELVEHREHVAEAGGLAHSRTWNGRCQSSLVSPSIQSCHA